MKLIDYRKALPRDLVKEVEQRKLIEGNLSAMDLATRLLSNDILQGPAAARYVSYLKLTYELCLAIAEIYDRRSPPGAEGKKEHLRHTGPADMMHIINYLYVLDSFGVDGCLLECGASHGFSTCCLSHACGMLGRKLFSADSFEGLPKTSDDEPFFREGDYASPLDAVKTNVAQLGRPDVTDYVVGWFSDSLKKWDRNIALLWVDVDLFDSARDVMENTVGHMNRKGGMVLHEFTDFHNRLPERDEKRPPNAVFDELEKNKVEYQSIHLHRYLGAVLLSHAVQPQSFQVLPALIEQLATLDDRSRKYAELRESRTVSLAFKVKKLIMGK